MDGKGLCAKRFCWGPCPIVFAFFNGLLPGSTMPNITLGLASIVPSRGVARPSKRLIGRHGPAGAESPLLGGAMPVTG